MAVSNRRGLELPRPGASESKLEEHGPILSGHPVQSRGFTVTGAGLPLSPTDPSTSRDTARATLISMLKGDPMMGGSVVVAPGRQSLYFSDPLSQDTFRS